MYKAAINFDVFRTQMFCPAAYFKPNPVMGKGGFTIEEAYRVISKSGPIETYKRDVTRVSPGAYWMYTEEYFYPSQFHIIGAGPKYTTIATSLDNSTIDTNSSIIDEIKPKSTDYEYIIATDANRLRLEVYARDPVAFFQKYNEKVLEFIRKNGFGGGSFWNAAQPIYQGPDCQWPSEREVFARRVLRNPQQGRRNAAQAQASPAAGGLFGLGGGGGGAGGFLGGINPQAIQSTLTNFFGTRVIQPQANFAGGQPVNQSPLAGLSFGQPPTASQSLFANPATSSGDNLLGANRQ